MRLLSSKVFLIPPLLVFLISGAFGKAENLDVLADSAKAFYLGGDIPDSRARADSILNADPQNPIANILTGLFRLSEGGLKNRTSAREIIEKYGRHLEDDPFANYALGVLYNAVDNPELAKKHFLRVVALDEKFVPALVELGLYYLDSMLKYYNRYTDTSIPLSYRDYALEDYDLGVSYLHKALDYDKDNKEAAYTLGSLFYEAQEYLAMTVLFNDQLKYHPEDRDLNLFMGLAYLSQFRYSDASQYFRRALKHMSAEDIELFQNPEYLIKDKKKLAEIDSQSTDFWKAQDPMFLTAENERLLEHYGRVAYANLRFSVPKLKIEGWRTDRGKTYIRYGKPLYIVEFAKSMEVNAIYPPSQIWVYPRFQLSFSDEFWNGEYRYSEPIAGSNSMFKERSNVDFGLAARNVFQEIPETFEFSLPGGEFDAPYRFTFFRSGKMAEALVSFAVPVEEALYEPAQELESGLYLLDDNKLPVFEKRESVTVDIQEPDSLSILKLDFRHGSGHFAYSFEILNKTLQKNFVDRQEVDIPDYSSGTLLMSDVLLASKIGPARKNDKFARNGLSLSPNIRQEYQKDDTLFLYFEVYNLKPGKQGSRHYTVENSIIQKQDGGFFRSILGKSQQKTTLVNEYAAKADSDFVVQSINLSNLQPGDYLLEISVSDDVASRKVSRRTQFTIIDSLTD